MRITGLEASMFDLSLGHMDAFASPPMGPRQGLTPDRRAIDAGTVAAA